MSIRIYNGRWLLNGGSLATGDDCCCDEAPTDDQGKYPCDCFSSWPSSLNLEITGLADYSIPGNGRCNCPLDGYGSGFNQTVVLDFAGVVTFDGCPSLAGGTNYKYRPYRGSSPGSPASFVVYSDAEPQGVAVYRGSLTNGSCDEYGVEVVLNAFGGSCAVLAAMDRLATGSPSICEPWVETSLLCNSWYLVGTFNSNCSSADLYVGGSVYGGEATVGAIAAGLT